MVTFLVTSLSNVVVPTNTNTINENHHDCISQIFIYSHDLLIFLGFDKLLYFIILFPKTSSSDDVPVLLSPFIMPYRPTHRVPINYY